MSTHFLENPASAKNLYFSDSYNSSIGVNKIMSIMFSMPNFLNSKQDYYNTFIFDHINALGVNSQFIVKDWMLDLPVIGNNAESQSILPTIIGLNSSNSSVVLNILSLSSGKTYKVYYALDLDTYSYSLINGILSVSGANIFLKSNISDNVFGNSIFDFSVMIDLTNFVFVGESNINDYAYQWSEASDERFPSNIKQISMNLKQNNKSIFLINHNI